MRKYKNGEYKESGIMPLLEAFLMSDTNFAVIDHIYDYTFDPPKTVGFFVYSTVLQKPLFIGIKSAKYKVSSINKFVFDKLKLNPNVDVGIMYLKDVLGNEFASPHILIFSMEKLINSPNLGINSRIGEDGKQHYMVNFPTYLGEEYDFSYY